MLNPRKKETWKQLGILDQDLCQLEDSVSWNTIKIKSKVALMPTDNLTNMAFLKQFQTSGKLTSVDFIKIWKHYDTNRTGFLEKNEILGFCKDLLQQDKDEVDDCEVKAFYNAVMQLYDINKDEKLSMAELASFLPVEKNFMSQFKCFVDLSNQNFDKIFQHYDINDDDSIEEEELEALIRDLLMKFGKRHEILEVGTLKDKILKHIDFNSDGKIQRDELRILFADPRLQFKGKGQ